MASKSSSDNMRSLERAIDVLEVVGNSHKPIRLSEVARRASLHVSTTQRILNVLEARGRVEKEDGFYRPGVTMLFGAHAYLSTSPLVTAALPILQQLADASGYTASVSVRFGLSRAVVGRVDGAQPLRYVAPPGERLPLTHGGGKVFAAYLPREELDRLIEEASTLDTADGVRVSAGHFRREMEQIREQGYSWSKDGRLLGQVAVSAPVLDVSGQCIASVQVSASSHAFPDEALSTTSLEVRQAAAALGERLGGTAAMEQGTAVGRG